MKRVTIETEEMVPASSLTYGDVVFAVDSQREYFYILIRIDQGGFPNNFTWKPINGTSFGAVTLTYTDRTEAIKYIVKNGFTVYTERNMSDLLINFFNLQK